MPVFYDSLLAKLIVNDADRPGAVARLRAALDATRITGIATNLPLLRAIAADDAFAAGVVTTSFLDERATELAEHSARARNAAVLAAAGALLRAGFGWRPGGIGIPLVLEHDGTRVQLTAERTPGGWRVRGDVEGDIPREGPAGPLDGSGVSIASPPGANAGAAAATYGSGSVSAPMPGKIVSVAVQAGGSVRVHDLLVVLEAMKMEHRIEAPIAGTVSAVHVAPGDLVPAGAALVTIGPA